MRSRVELDLAPFYGTQIDEFLLCYNYALRELVNSGNPRDHGSIHVNSFSVQTSGIARAGFGDALKYFSNQMTSFDAHLGGNDRADSDSDQVELGFLSGLSNLTNLSSLEMSFGISGPLTADTWIPKELQNLNRITLYGNDFDQVGENVFDLFVGGANHVLEIQLDWKKLNETGFHPNSGIARPGRQTALGLTSNQIRTLPFQIFETFLDAHPQNLLKLYGNPLICDQRVSWLKSRREDLERRVLFAECSNDEGHTVFDSALIP